MHYVQKTQPYTKKTSERHFGTYSVVVGLHEVAYCVSVRFWLMSRCLVSRIFRQLCSSFCFLCGVILKMVTSSKDLSKR